MLSGMLPRAGRMDTGRQLEGNCLSSLFLKIGVTRACFQSDGNAFAFTERLKRCVRDSVTAGAIALRSRFVSPSGTDDPRTPLGRICHPKHFLLESACTGQKPALQQVLNASCVVAGHSI